MYFDYWYGNGSDSDNEITQRMTIAQSPRNEKQVSTNKENRKPNERRMKIKKLKWMKSVIKAMSPKKRLEKPIKIKKLKSTKSVKKAISPKKRHEERIKIKKLKSTKRVNKAISPKKRLEEPIKIKKLKSKQSIRKAISPKKRHDKEPKQLHRAICKEIGKNPDDPEYTMVRRFKGEIFKIVAANPTASRFGGSCGLPNCGNEFM